MWSRLLAAVDGWRAESAVWITAGVAGGLPKLLFDPKKPVVLRGPFPSRRRPGLDLPRAGGHGDVRDGGVLGLPRAVADHHAVPRVLRHSNHVERFGQRAD